MSAEQFWALSDDGYRYELIDGVVVMSPSPTPKHQRVASVIHGELYAHVTKNRLGLLLFETDIRLGRRAEGRDLIYRPEIIFVAASRVSQIQERIEIAPDLVVEIVSPESHTLDTQTKFGDYEMAGVREYWLIDPLDEGMGFHRLANGRFQEIAPDGDRFVSDAVAGFSLDLSLVREAFRSLV